MRPSTGWCGLKPWCDASQRERGTISPPARYLAPKEIIMSVTTLIGAAIGSAIDGSSGDDSNLDGAIGGAIAAKVITAVIPLALTFATGWFVLRGIGKLKDEVFGADEPVRR
jgi:hypothetical protein